MTAPYVPGPGPAPAQQQPPAPPRRSILPWLVAGVAVLIAAGAWLYASRDAGGPTPAATAAATADLVAAPPAKPVSTFEWVQKTCDPTEQGTTVTDGGATLIIDGWPDGRVSGEGLDIEKLSCVLAALGMPDAVKAQMNDTSALDGRQTASWDGHSASWTYHPDNGLDAIITTA